MLGVPAASRDGGGLEAAAGGGTMVVHERGESDLGDPALLGRELAARMLALGAADLIGAMTDRDDGHD